MELAQTVTTREELVALMRQIHHSSCSGDLSDLDHGDLAPGYIEAASGWLEDAVGSKLHPTEPQTAAETYRLVAMCLVAGLIYE